MNGEHRMPAVEQSANNNQQCDHELQELLTFASRVCDTPIALITILDKDTEWVRARVGIDANKVITASSFCRYVVQQDDILVVPDAQLDERFANDLLVVNDPEIRFYAGMPLVTNDGYRLGSLCVIDTKPRVLNEQQEIMLSMLAKHATSTMELKLNRELLEKKILELEKQQRIIDGNEIRLRYFFESSANVHVLIGKKGEVIEFNKVASNVSKKVLNKDPKLGDQITDYIMPAERDEFIHHYKLALKGHKSEYEKFSNYGNNNQIWWEVVLEPARNRQDEIIGISYMLRNINDRKLNEQKIKEQNKSLRNIAQIQSHDYRGPLATILGLLNLVKEDGYKAPKEYLMMLETAANNLDEKIHQVIDVINESEEKEPKVN